MKVIYRTSAGRTYESHDMSAGEAEARLRHWRDGWENGARVAGATTFADAVVSSAHIVAVEAPGLIVAWPDR